MYSKPQKLAAEFFGTFVVVLACIAAVCGDQLTLRGSPVNHPAGAGSSGIGPLGVALAYGLAFACMTAAVGRISGGHFNPAISIGTWATQRMNTFDVVAYCAAQLAGATVAAYLLRMAVPEAIWRAAALGTPDLALGVTRSPAMLVEGLGTFAVAFAVCATTYRKTIGGGALAAVASGIAITAASYFASPFTGGSLNPARAFGPALVSAQWANYGVYWIGPLAGGALAAWTCNRLFPASQPQTLTP